MRARRLYLALLFERPAPRRVWAVSILMMISSYLLLVVLLVVVLLLSFMIVNVIIIIGASRLQALRLRCAKVARRWGGRGALASYL